MLIWILFESKNLYSNDVINKFAHMKVKVQPAY